MLQIEYWFPFGGMFRQLTLSETAFYYKHKEPIENYLFAVHQIIATVVAVTLTTSLSVSADICLTNDLKAK